MTFFDWLKNICDTEVPDDNIIAYHFGLFETEDGYTIYLTGSSEFDADAPDWVLNEDFVPAKKYFVLTDSKDLHWKQVLEKVQTFLADFMNSAVYTKSFFGNAKAITTGFDDGDLVLIK